MDVEVDVDTGPGPGRGLQHLFRGELATLIPVAPPRETGLVLLDCNEAPGLLGAVARRRLAEVAADAAMGWERYPDHTMADLRRAIAEACRVSPEEVLAGAGSDEVIAMLVTALRGPSGRRDAPTLLVSPPTFAAYEIAAQVHGWQVARVPLETSWRLPLPALERALVERRPNLLFVASPNNPTANLAGLAELEALIRAAPDTLVVIDEAYVDYADRDHFELYRRYENVALLRTLSKVGFASLRVGWLIARPELVAAVQRVRLPYNLPALSQRLAAVALRELGPERAALAAAVRAERARIQAELATIPRVSAAPSDANFLWLRTEPPGAGVFSALRARGVLVRSFHARGGAFAHHLRVTVGTRPENDRFLAALREVV